MSRTKVIIGYLPPLLALEDPELELFITKLVTFETNTDQWGMPMRFCKLLGTPASLEILRGARGLDIPVL